MKVLERVAENFLRQQCASMTCSLASCLDVAPDAIFIVPQLQEKFCAIKETLYTAFVDLKMTCNHVPRRVIWWALCKLDIDRVVGVAHTEHV